MFSEGDSIELTMESPTQLKTKSVLWRYTHQDPELLP